MKCKMALLKTDEGFSVSGPGLPGCWSQGSTEEDAMPNIQDSVRRQNPVNAFTMSGIVRDAGPRRRTVSRAAVATGFMPASDGRAVLARRTARGGAMAPS